MKIKLLLVLLLGLLLFTKANATEEKTVVRVGISNQNFSSFDYKRIKLSSQDDVKIISISQNIEIEPAKAGEIIEVVLSEQGYDIYIDGVLKHNDLIAPLIFSSNSGMDIVELNRKGMPAKYKGMIEISNSKKPDYFNVINVVDMQNYLRGVVPNEMPERFGLEALKAQSVAARNYANNAQINPNYDVVDSTASQVYYGVNSYSPLADEAVYQTYGIYALHNEKPITAMYFSTSPGITDDWEDVFGNGVDSGRYPYLKPRFDLDNKPLKSEKDVKEFYSRNDNGYDIDSPKFRWNIQFAKEELEEVLHNTLQQQSKVGFVTPYYDGSQKIEDIKKIEAIKRTASGKITELKISSKTGDYKIRTQLAIRRVFRKNNTMLPSTNFYVEEFKDGLFEKSEIDEGFSFIGGGFGHNVGMSQFGAYSLAKSGKKFSEILNHYYTDIVISTMPKLITYNTYNIKQKTNFYFDNTAFKKAYLLINNQKGIENFPLQINDFVFNETKNISNKKVIKIDVTEYLRNGINVIVFEPLDESCTSKELIYRIEFQ